MVVDVRDSSLELDYLLELLQVHVLIVLDFSEGLNFQKVNLIALVVSYS